MHFNLVNPTRSLATPQRCASSAASLLVCLYFPVQGLKCQMLQPPAGRQVPVCLATTHIAPRNTCLAKHAPSANGVCEDSVNHQLQGQPCGGQPVLFNAADPPFNCCGRLRKHARLRWLVTSGAPAASNKAACEPCM
jgi:hypothetical protein